MNPSLEGGDRSLLGSAGQFGVDCATAPEARRRIAASAVGVYPSAHGGVSVDFARHLAGAFQGGRLAIDLASGSMPTVVAGEQGDAHWYAAVGVSFMLGFGAGARAADQPAD
ncbi:hypothetical protein WME97_33485 [Sorangium sp. So ce367]|uniref:hypothetical protein n=1 Tax=Sorangium sp. So ce367 TaxID=3133305 RepID=UPI003F63B554